MPTTPDEESHSETPRISGMSDAQVMRSSRDELLKVLAQLKPPILEGRVARRLQYFDEPTLKRIAFLCRRATRYQENRNIAL